VPETFDFSRFPILTTERLRLRQLTHDDADAIVALFGSPEVLRFLNQPPTDTPEKAIGLIDWLNALYEKHEPQWAITLNGDDRLIGTCGTIAWDRDNRHIDIGYHVLPSQWGNGYATEATRAVVRWCFEHMDIHRIQADCTDGNIGSERVLLKCGFKIEGLWRESCWEHGRFVDIKQFGLLRREFSA
jgi:[ribosomal protein S5]-alanine N-acetyltransferase